MDESKRRPFIDWIHTANVQGEPVRNYVKWDYQPASIEGVPDTFARAYSIMMTEPQGPIYMCYDAWLQEAPLSKDVALPTAPARCRRRWRPTARRSSGRRAAAGGEMSGVDGRVCRRAANGFDDMVALAETVGAAVLDVKARLNFPNRHPLNLSCEKDVFRDADLILGARHARLGEVDPLHRPHQAPGGPLYPPNCEWIEIGFGDIDVSKWSMDYQRIPACSLRVLADTLPPFPR